jgi:hypothetical protein
MTVSPRTIARDRQIAIAGVVLAPVLLVLGLAIGYEPALIVGIVPLEHAWIQGAIAGPMLLVAPGALSLAWLEMRVARIGTWLTAAIAILIALGVAGWVAASVSQIGCQPVTDAIQTLPIGLIWGGVAAIGFVVAVRSGHQQARNGRPLKAFVAAVGVALLALVADAAAFLLLFPPLMCAPPRLT